MRSCFISLERDFLESKFLSVVVFSSYSQPQFPQQGNQNQFGPMMMNNSIGATGPVSGAGAGQMGQMPGQRQSQMGMNPMGMGRMPMGPDQVRGHR